MAGHIAEMLRTEMLMIKDSAMHVLWRTGGLSWRKQLPSVIWLNSHIMSRTSAILVCMWVALCVSM